MIFIKEFAGSSGDFYTHILKKNFQSIHWLSQETSIKFINLIILEYIWLNHPKMSPGGHEFIPWLSQYVGWTDDNFLSLLAVTGRSANAIALTDPLGQPEHYGKTWDLPKLSVTLFFLHAGLCLLFKYMAVCNWVYCEADLRLRARRLWISLICRNFCDWLWQRKLKVDWKTKYFDHNQIGKRILEDVVTVTP